jgi:hypothetical protein
MNITLLSLLIVGPFVSLLLLFWHKTNFFTTYGKLFGLKKILKIDLFEQKKLSNLDLTYPQFLGITFNGFFIRLLSCIVCISTWLTIIPSIILYLEYRDVITLYLIPLNILLGLFIYLKIKKLL